jgi:hypothetical protein
MPLQRGFNLNAKVVAAIIQTSIARTGMYGPPPYCKRKMKVTELVCANVSGLCWSSYLLA